MSKRSYHIFDHMIEGVQVISPEWKYVYVNDAITTQGKSTRDELLGHTMMEKYPGIENTEMFGHIAKCMNEQVSCQMLNQFEFPDGSKGWFDLRMEPVKEGVLIMSFDVTAQKQLEEELRKLNEDLESKVQKRTMELQKSLNHEMELNEMKSAFVSMASHEFRTPLTAILTSAELAALYKEAGQVQKSQAHLKRIKSSVAHLNSILNKFLSLGKLESGKAEYHPAPLSLREFINEMLADLQLLCKRGQKIQYIHKGKLDIAHFDKHVIQNVIINLISNAIKYSPNGEDIDVITGLTNSTLIIKVADRGIGIPIGEQKRMFDKFFRASNSHEVQGTGLGLNIVKKYLDLAGGRIAFQSKENAGTTFTVSIPQQITQRAPSL